MYDSKSYSGTSGCHLASAPSWFKGWVLQMTSKPPFCSTVATTIMQLSLRGRELYVSKRSNDSFCQLQERTSHELRKQWVSLVASEDQTKVTICPSLPLHLDPPMAYQLPPTYLYTYYLPVTLSVLMWGLDLKRYLSLSLDRCYLSGWVPPAVCVFLQILSLVPIFMKLSDALSSQFYINHHHLLHFFH